MKWEQHGGKAIIIKLNYVREFRIIYISTIQHLNQPIDENITN